MLCNHFQNFQCWVENILLGQRRYFPQYQNQCENKNPIFISIGHKADLDSSVGLVKSLVRKYRTPEPIRLAQLFANKQKDGEDIDVKMDVGQESLF